MNPKLSGDHPYTSHHSKAVALCAALLLRSCVQLTAIKLPSCEIGDGDIDFLAHELKNSNKIIDCNIRANSIGELGFKSVLSAIAHFRSLKGFEA
eukprot:209871-Rhodomonas_salina.1